MPRITVPLAANYENITRPVGTKIARDVMAICGLDKNTPLYMPGEFSKINMPGSNMDKKEETRWESYERVFVTLEDYTRGSSILNQVVRDNDLPAIIEDERLGISVRPVYVQSDITLSFKYTASTRQQAIRWRDDFAIRQAENRTSISHEIAYDILFHDTLLELLAYLHELREKTSGYGDTFVEWFKSIQKRPFSMLGAQDGDMLKTILSVPEKQAQITGWFDFETAPKENKVEGNSTWEIEFVYKTMYHRCTHLYVAYPMMVHQSHIKKDYFSDKPRFGVEELNKKGGIGVTALDVLDGYYNQYPGAAGGLRVPFYDEWAPGQYAAPANHVSALTWMIALSTQDPCDILDLMDPGYGITFTLDMIEYMKSQHRYLHQRGGAALLLTLFSGDAALDHSEIYITEDLKVRSVRPLDMRQQYHLRISFGTRYGLFSKRALTDMQKHPAAVLQIFQSIVPRLNVEWAWKRLLDGRFLGLDYIQWFYNWTHLRGYGADNNPPHQNGPGGGNGYGPINDGNGSAGNGQYINPDYDADPGETSGGNWNTGKVTDPDEDPEKGQPYPTNAKGGSGGRYVQFLAIVSMKASKA